MSAELTPENLAAIRKRAEAATEGPWIAEFSGEQGNCVLPHDAQSTREAVAITRLYHQVFDAEFIAHAREDVPRLLAEVERLTGEVNALQYQRDYAIDMSRSLTGERDTLQARLDKVRALHKARPLRLTGTAWMLGATEECWGCGSEYPCPTIQALAGSNQ